MFDARYATHARAAKNHRKSRRFDLTNRSPARRGAAKIEPGATPNAMNLLIKRPKRAKNVQEAIDKQPRAKKKRPTTTPETAHTRAG